MASLTASLARSLRFIMSGADVVVSPAAVAWAVLVLGFALFQKRLLPPKLAALAAKAYFYPTLPLTYARLVLLPPHAGLWTEVDDTLVVGAAPTSLLGHPARLRKLGVRAVVNCCDEYMGPDWRKHDIQHLWLPTVDHNEPSIHDLETAVRFIDSFRARGQRVFVHCKAGHGRSAAVAYAWLLHVNYGKIAPFELYEHLAAKRKIRKNIWQQPNILRFYESLPLKVHLAPAPSPHSAKVHYRASAPSMLPTALPADPVASSSMAPSSSSCGND